MKEPKIRLLPCPRSLKVFRGTLTLPDKNPLSVLKVVCNRTAPAQPEGYTLAVSKNGIEISVRDHSGLRPAAATLRQLVREYGRKIPFLKIRDWPDFPRRGVMLDISRGRVPNLETLLDLVEKLADFKINEFQIYTEHTFAYKKYRRIWQSWGALTAKEIKFLDVRCRELGIDLVPNQNSFGHLRYFLEDPKLKKLGELSKPFLAETGDFLRRPTTLAPRHPGTLPFVRGLYDELLPNFSSKFFNIGGDETWDLGKGRSKKICERIGKGRVYLDFIKKLHLEVAARNRTMMFWGDIVLKQPALIRELPRDIIALNWGYEADHPFAREAAQFRKAKIKFYVCPGTSTWQTLLGRHENAFANLRAAAKIGKKFGAAGYLNTEWGDGGHPQPLAVSWPLFAAGAALAWNADALDEKVLAGVLNRDVFEDGTGTIAQAGIKLGFAHQKLGVKAMNETPLGTVIAAPKPADQELFCRHGLKWFAKIPANKIKAALAEIEKQRSKLNSVTATRQPSQNTILVHELDLAARMAAQSCKFMLWQQVVTAGKKSEAHKLAQRGIRELQQLEKDFNAYWPVRNHGTTGHCSPFLRWRIEDYKRGRWS
ncbi:MAG TPA: family 20 glycosylhydrolase [Candidatus Sulfotelmatobacter sp.]|jgi:hexosaminidase|nr:family 20 glycosylhydrolase [Candidatus Sulfotelmatobacter sp.]